MLVYQRVSWARFPVAISTRIASTLGVERPASLAFLGGPHADAPS